MNWRGRRSDGDRPIHAESRPRDHGSVRPRPISLAMVDNDPLTLQLLGIRFAQLLPGCVILWTAGSGADALARLHGDGHVDGRRPSRVPDVLLVDMSMEDMGGPALCRAIRTRSATPTILAMTAFSLGRYAGDAAASGAQGIVSKHDTTLMVEAIRQVARGGTWPAGPGDPGVPGDPIRTFEPARTAWLRLQGERPAGVDALNDTELRLVELCSRGYTAERMAAELGRSASTINTHLERAIRKTGAGNRTQLVAMWLRARLG